MPAPAESTMSQAAESAQNLVLCKVCADPFMTMQDCLAHELLNHTNKPQKQLRQRFNAIHKLFASPETQIERNELKELLEKEKSRGQKLRAVLDFYVGDLARLQSCYRQVCQCIEKEMDGLVNVYPFGSLVTGLGLKDSDIDLFLELNENHFQSRGLNQKQLYNKVFYFLRRTKCFADVFAIRHARVPIIRCKHQLTGLSIDINMSNPNSTHNSRFVGNLMSDPRFREFCLLLKIWSKKLKIIGQGSMTSYCLTTLIIFFMQQRQFLPSIREMQSMCPPTLVWGINFGYSLHLVTPLPNGISILRLMGEFFKFYSNFNFNEKVVCPFLGCALDKESFVASTNNDFPEYENQLLAMKRALGEMPEPLQVDRCVCAQDPFELQHNVARGISQTNLSYIKRCMALAAQACANEELLSKPEKLFDFLLFGLADKLVEEANQERSRPSKQLKKSEEQEKLPQSGNTPPLARTHMLTPSSNDLKSLRSDLIKLDINDKQTIHYYWLDCYVSTIQDVLTKIYALKIELIESKSMEGDLPCYYKWLIKTSLDTWTGRCFQRPAGQSFFSHQLQQTIEFVRTRNQNATYAVSLLGHLVLKASSDYTDLQLEVQPMPADVLGLQRNSPLTKFFKSFKNLLTNYTFKEKVKCWKYTRPEK